MHTLLTQSVLMLAKQRRDMRWLVAGDKRLNPVLLFFCLLLLLLFKIKEYTKFKSKRMQ